MSRDVLPHHWRKRCDPWIVNDDWRAFGFEGIDERLTFDVLIEHRLHFLMEHPVVVDVRPEDTVARVAVKDRVLRARIRHHVLHPTALFNLFPAVG